MNLSLPDFWYRDPGTFLAALIVLLLPGLAVEAWLRDDPEGPRRDLLSQLSDTVALSVAVTALVALWLWVARIRLSGGMVAALYALCLLAILAAILRRGLRPLYRARPQDAMLALLLVIALVAWRFYQARGLVLPSWVDSVHHTLLVRVILEGGGLPRDFQPYIPAPAYYHYGFHLLAALHAALAGVSPDRAVLWLGQVLNAAVALSVYRAAFAFRAGQQPEEGRLRFSPQATALVAALLTGFALQMPAYYLSWGRYTLLTGLILLGPVLAAALEFARNLRVTAAGLRLALLISGLVAVHYFALLLAGLFVAVVGIFLLARIIRARKFSLRKPGSQPLLRLVAWALLGLALALPWLVWVFQHTQPYMDLNVANLAIQDEAAQQRITDSLNYLRYLTGPRHNHFLLGFAALGLLFSLRRPALRPLAAWALILTVNALPWGLRLGPFRPDHYVIVLFFPAAILLAELLAQAVEALVWAVRLPEDLRRESALMLLALVVGGLLVWGGRETRRVSNQATVIATAADVRALDWVNANLPGASGARFFINSARWQNDYRGVDGGYWLMPYTGRSSLVPPIYYTWGSREYVRQITGWAERAQTVNGCTPEFWALVREANLTHAYLREGVGSLQPAALESCPGARQVYAMEGVFIFELQQP